MRPFRVHLVPDEVEFIAKVGSLRMCFQLLHDGINCRSDSLVELNFSEPKLKVIWCHYYVDCVKAFDCLIRSVLVVELGNGRDGVKVAGK